MAKKSSSITTSSTAEYFSKNLQQVGFSSQTKAVLTTLKEAVDNSLDACEENGMLPELWIKIEKMGSGSMRNSDKIRVRVEDNGPGIDPDDISKVFGEYLASSKFGRGRCSRGQQGIGISAATTWAQLTSASGAKIKTKTKSMRKAISCSVEVDIKNNRGSIKDKNTFDWDRPHGTSVEFTFDGRIQINGEAGLLSYINGNILVNPHMTLHYQLPEQEWVTVERVSEKVPRIPDATNPHPHTMKLGEFIAHSHLFSRMKTSAWLKKGFSRVSDSVINQLKKSKHVSASIFSKNVESVPDKEFKGLYAAIQETQLLAPTTQSVMSIGEEVMAKSIRRLGNIDFISVISRRPTICDFKPVQVEVAVARLEQKVEDADFPVQVLRFANRVPLQFDKAGCAMVQAITSVNWKAYGLLQPKRALPQGPYIIAVSLVSPFIKFKNASKETVDASDELVEEIRRALMQAGQKLARHIRRESKERELEEKIKHMEQFGPILVEGLVRITKSSKTRQKKAEEGLAKILGRDATETEKQLSDAEEKLAQQKEREARKLGKKIPSKSDPEEFDQEQMVSLPADDGKESGRSKAKKKKTSSKKPSVKKKERNDSELSL